MRKISIIVMVVILSIVFSGCAYRHYMGVHGPSIRAFPDNHEGVTEDKDCLKCHHPEKNPEGPPTNHPHFTGCLKCHNDDL